MSLSISLYWSSTFMLIGLYINPSLHNECHSLSVNLLLNSDWKFLAVVLTVSLWFCISFSQEFVFLGLVVELSTNWVKVVSLPVGLGSLSLHDLIICGNLGIVVLSVLVCHNVVLARNVQSLVLIFLALNKKLVEFLHLQVHLVEDASPAAGSDAPAYRCLK